MAGEGPFKYVRHMEDGSLRDIVCLCVFWSLGELCCCAGCISSWQVHPSQTGPMLKDRQSLMLPGGGGLSMRLITSPYKTIRINKYNDCCHMENFEMAKKRVIRTMSCVLLLGITSLSDIGTTGHTL
jgi:hypothetical protein